jgi:chloramphenicol-sensitive protein RarD
VTKVHSSRPEHQGRRGVWFGLSAYGMWGLFPLYWPLLEPTPATQILAHRMLWSAVFVGAIVAVRHRGPALWALRREPRRIGLLALAAVLVSVNWGVYIWAVNAGHVVETSLGYFINPLVSIALGVLVLRERLRRVQWVAVGIGAIAVAVIAIDYGRLPWIALTLAASFGSYGLVKKLAAVPALDSMAVETALMALPALAFLVVVGATGTGSFGRVAVGTDALLVLAGAVTAIPLLCFAAAARRVPLSILGLLQYLTPVLQFAVGVYVRHEPLPTSELIGFALVWVSLAVLGASEFARWRRRPASVVEAPAVSDAPGVPAVQEPPAVGHGVAAVSPTADELSAFER